MCARTQPSAPGGRKQIPSLISRRGLQLGRRSWETRVEEGGGGEEVTDTLRLLQGSFSLLLQK